MTTGEGLHVFQWAWEAETQLPEDAFVNTWHFYNNVFPYADYENVRDMLLDFYSESFFDMNQPLCEYMTSNTISGNYTLKAYNLDDPKPRAVVYLDQGTVAPGNLPGLPTECAAVFSYQATQESGLPQARRRNRIYFGPISTEGAGDSGRIANNLVQDMLFSGRQLKEASDASANWTWSVYSPTDNEFYATHDGWVDNGMDTQRRRGLRSTQRGVFGLEYPT